MGESARARRNRERAERSIHDDEELNDPWSQKTAVGLTPSEVAYIADAALSGYGVAKGVGTYLGKKALQAASKKKVLQLTATPKPPVAAKAVRMKLPMPKKPAPPLKPNPSAANKGMMPRTGRLPEHKLLKSRLWKDMGGK